MPETPVDKGILGLECRWPMLGLSMSAAPVEEFEVGDLDAAGVLEPPPKPNGPNAAPR